MTGVKLRTSGIESDHSTNWATTTSLAKVFGGAHINLNRKLQDMIFCVFNAHMPMPKTGSFQLLISLVNYLLLFKCPIICQRPILKTAGAVCNCSNILIRVLRCSISMNIQIFIVKMNHRQRSNFEEFVPCHPRLGPLRIWRLLLLSSFIHLHKTEFIFTILLGHSNYSPPLHLMCVAEQF